MKHVLPTAVLLCLIGIGICYGASRSQRSAQKRLHAGEFVFLSGGEAHRLQIIECPNHAFGSMKDGLEELKKRLAKKPSGSPILSQLCVSQQIESIKMYLPFLDVIGINPYVSGSDKGPDAKSLIWPGYDHPLINRIRQMRELAGDTVLLGRIGIGGVESKYITKRLPTFEEVRWWIYAIIGAEFKGVIWVGGFDSGGRLRRMAAEVSRYAVDLGKAQLVDWVKCSKGQPLSALSSDKRLFVVVLNTAYFKNIETGKKLPLPLPLSLSKKPAKIRIELHLPKHLEITSAQTLGGYTLPLQKGKERVVVEFGFDSSAEIFIFDLSRNDLRTKGPETKK